MNKRNFVCTVTSISCYNEPNETTPHTMRGTFQYDNYDEFEFEVRFEPMGGCSTGIIINGRYRPLLGWNEHKYSEIADAAMTIACNNATAVEPEDFKWTIRHIEQTWVT